MNKHMDVPVYVTSAHIILLSKYQTEHNQCMWNERKFNGMIFFRLVGHIQTP